MQQIIQASLSRQAKALALLRELLEDEYQILLKRDTDAVASLEFSIQELIRQIAVEKSLVIRFLGGQKVCDYAQAFAPQERDLLLELFDAVDVGEQDASRQASRNAQLSLALLDQSSDLLQALTSQVASPKAGTYGRRGGMRHELHPQAALISGRL